MYRDVVVLLVPLAMLVGCSPSVVSVRPDQLPRLTHPTGADIREERATGAVVGNAVVGLRIRRVIAVEGADGRVVQVRTPFHLILRPHEGPSRVFLDPVLVRLVGGVLEIRSANRPAAYIRLEDVRSAEVHQ